MSTQTSISPEGEKFALPTPEQYPAEFARLKKLVDQNRAEGREIVVVVGFLVVGAVMAAVVADSRDKATGKHNKFVIGMQRPSPRSIGKSSCSTAASPPLRPKIPRSTSSSAAASRKPRRSAPRTRTRL